MADNSDIALLRRAETLGIKRWPYGVDDASRQKQMLDWAELYRLKFYDAYQQCPHWLIAGRSPDLIGRYAKDGNPRDSDGCREKYEFDHVTCWTRDGIPAVIVSQPYNIHMPSLIALGDLAREDLDVYIHGTGWYGGGTVCVEIWSARPEPRYHLPLV
jgi:hypothetical protein